MDQLNWSSLSAWWIPSNGRAGMKEACNKKAHGVHAVGFTLLDLISNLKSEIAISNL